MTQCYAQSKGSKTTEAFNISKQWCLARTSCDHVSEGHEYLDNAPRNGGMFIRTFSLPLPRFRLAPLLLVSPRFSRTLGLELARCSPVRPHLATVQKPNPRQRDRRGPRPQATYVSVTPEQATAGTRPRRHTNCVSCKQRERKRKPRPSALFRLWVGCNCKWCAECRRSICNAAIPFAKGTDNPADDGLGDKTKRRTGELGLRLPRWWVR